jgi:hypothetical protein
MKRVLLFIEIYYTRYYKLVKPPDIQSFYMKLPKSTHGITVRSFWEDKISDYYNLRSRQA